MANNTAEDEAAAVRLLYEETARVAAKFWDWRHKVILLCSAMVTVVLGVAAWLYTRELGGIALGIPFAVGAVIAAICRVFDRRNGQILEECFAIGRDLERRLSDPGASRRSTTGIYTAIHENRLRPRPFQPHPGTYSYILRRAYLGLAIFFLIAFVAATVLGIVAPDQLVPKAEQ